MSTSLVTVEGIVANEVFDAHFKGMIFAFLMAKPPFRIMSALLMITPRCVVSFGGSFRVSGYRHEVREASGSVAPILCMKR